MKMQSQINHIVTQALDGPWQVTLRQTLPLLLTMAGCLWMSWLVFVNLWASEDAYITYRVIDNFHQGYGLRWNIYERVQAYTHPLWMLLHLPITAVWDNIFHAGLAISFICSMAAIIVALLSTKRPIANSIVFFFLPLTLSKCFIDYTSSGLENPLSYLLFSVFIYIVLNKQESRFFWLLCSFSIALALLNRLDVAIIYAPLLLWIVWVRRHDIRWGHIILGATPLLLWFAFSLTYYGFLFPNTKYAKLNTDMNHWRYVLSAIHYTKYFIVTDLLSAMLLLTPLAWIILALRKEELRQNITSGIPLFLSLGVYYYGVYIVYIGGDYMSGRFWALPIFITVWLLYAFIPRLRPDVLFCVLCSLLVAYAIPILLKDIQKNCHTCITNKQRLLDAKHTFRGNSLLTSRWPIRIRPEGQYTFSNEGKKIAKEHRTKARRMYYIGMAGFYAGATTPLIDELGLADPLLARLPAAKNQNFNIGHFRRHIPHGYSYAATTGSTDRMHKSLAKYYDKLRVIISSEELFSSERISTIIKFNLGEYDHWRDEYVKQSKP